MPRRSYAHLIVRKEHVLCTTCKEIEPINAGDGTPLPTLEKAFALLKKRHPAQYHARPHRVKE